LTDSFGLLADLRGGRKVTSASGLIKVEFDGKKNEFVFTVKGEGKLYTNPFRCAHDIDRNDGYDGRNKVYMFKYREMLCFGVGYDCGMRGTETCFSMVRFSYDPQSRRISNIIIGEETAGGGES
jgi:hypothetical protein